MQQNQGNGMARKATQLRALALAAVLGSITATSCLAQAPSPAATDPVPVFEVSVVKPHKLEGMGQRFQIGFSPDSFNATGLDLKMLIQQAYGVQEDQIVGSQKLLSAQYDITAKMDAETAAKLDKLSPDQSRLVRSQMLQTLLADRFNLKVHHETRELPTYALVVAKNGLKLQPTKIVDTPGATTPEGHPVGSRSMMRFGGGKLSGQDISTTELARMLPRLVGHLVVDKTGLTGKYDFDLQFTPDTNRPAMSAGPDAGHEEAGTDSSGPSIFTALQEQLGLKLEPQKAPVDVIVIDRLDPPTEN